MSSTNDSSNEIEIYVSLAGNDENSGTKSEPFRTVLRAQKAARQLIADGLKNRLNIYLREGVYELPETLHFGPQDSGAAEAPVTYASAPGETAVLSGGQRVSGWRTNDDGTWSVNLPDVANGKWFFRHLTVDGKRAVRGRWPKKHGELRVEQVEDGLKEFTFDKAIPATISAESGTELVIFQVWSITRGLVMDAGGKRAATATAMGWVGHKPTSAMPGRAAFIENAPEFVNQPGEWCLDRKTGVLTYFPREGENPESSIAVAPRLEQLIRVTGEPGEPVENLHFKNLSFEHTNFPLPSFGYNEIQAAHYGTVFEKEEFHVQPLAIEFVNAERCLFENCRLAHLGASGIGLGPGCRNDTIKNCQIEDIGGNGVMVGWRGAGELAPGRTTLSADWADTTMAPTNNEVSNCRIRRCGTDSMGSVGIFVAFSADTKISHNHVHDLPYSGISIGYRWDKSESSQVRCLVENNHIHDVMKLFIDGGGIYTLGYQPGTVLRGNHIHDVQSSPVQSLISSSRAMVFSSTKAAADFSWRKMLSTTPRIPLRASTAARKIGSSGTTTLSAAAIRQMMTKRRTSCVWPVPSKSKSRDGSLNWRLAH